MRRRQERMLKRYLQRYGEARTVLSHAFFRCEKLGSTTAVLAILDGEMLIPANVGDSGFLLLRRSTSSSSTAEEGGAKMVSKESVSSRSSNESPKNAQVPLSSSNAIPIPHQTHMIPAGCAPASGAGSKSGPASTSTASTLQIDASATTAAFRVIARSTPQLHSFNCPFQLTRMPDLQYFDDLPTKWMQARRIESVRPTLVQPNDVLITASDGIFDNLFEKDVVDIVNQTVAEAVAATVTEEPRPTALPPRLVSHHVVLPDGLEVTICERLMAQAIKMAYPGSGQTPFGLSCAELRYYCWAMFLFIRSVVLLIHH